MKESALYTLFEELSHETAQMLVLQKDEQELRNKLAEIGFHENTINAVFKLAKVEVEGLELIVQKLTMARIEGYTTSTLELTLQSLKVPEYHHEFILDITQYLSDQLAKDKVIAISGAI